MNGNEEGIEKAVEKVKEAEVRVERDEAQLQKDQAKERQAIEELEAAERHHEIIIIVDGAEHKVRPGEWAVAALKAQLGIDPAKVLAEITSHGLKDLADDAKIELHNHERFMTHARSGGSS
jgi:hypothetical protein